MLTKQDMTKVEGMMDERFRDFWENMLEPYLSKMHNEISQMNVRMTRMESNMIRMESKLDQSIEDVSAHERRVMRLEIKNNLR